MADLRISQLPALGAAALQADDIVASVDISASETKKITVKDLVQKSVTLIDAGSIPGDKITFSIPDGSIGTVQLADKSVTALKLADNSTALIASPLPTGVFVGQLGVDGGVAYIWNGGSWVPLFNGIVKIHGGTVGPVTTTVTTVNNEASVLAKIDNSAVPAAFVAGPTASAGEVSLRPIVPGDLPIASASTAGVVTVPAGGGLTIDGGVSGLGSDLVVDNDVAPANDQLVSYNEKGLVISGRPIQGSDLPIATNGSVGAISAGPEFTVKPSGELNLANIVTGATYPVITYDNNGLVTSGRDLTDSDIPALPADKITSGTFNPSLFADKSISKEMLADYTIAYIQEDQPVVTSDDHVGILWYQESTAQLRMWNSNSWMPVGFGRLSNENLRWGGLVNAATGLVAGVTEVGTTAGLKIGEKPPVATDALGGLYLLVSEAGNNIEVTPGVSYDAGDWCLCINEAEGWIRIDTLSGGGGGGGASTLSDLLDVTITGPLDGQVLMYNGTSNIWVNATAIDGGTF